MSMTIVRDPSGKLLLRYQHFGAKYRFCLTTGEYIPVCNVTKLAEFEDEDIDAICECTWCDDPTGRTTEDALYVGEEGPLCPEHYDEKHETGGPNAP